MFDRNHPEGTWVCKGQDHCLLQQHSGIAKVMPCSYSRATLSTQALRSNWQKANPVGTPGGCACRHELGRILYTFDDID